MAHLKHEKGCHCARCFEGTRRKIGLANQGRVSPLKGRTGHPAWNKGRKFVDWTICRKCHKDDIEFHKNQRICKSCQRDLRNQPHRKRSDAKTAKVSRHHLKQQVLDHYGSICQCCGENHFEFLTIDHPHGGGNKHRKEIRTTIYNWLKRNNYPQGFRVLCMNCNFSLGKYGYCPHGPITQKDQTQVARGNYSESERVNT